MRQATREWSAVQVQRVYLPGCDPTLGNATSPIVSTDQKLLTPRIRAFAHMTEFPLSPREKQMLRRLAKGWSTVEIRKSIGGTLDQVQEQQFRLLRKLQINSQKELIDAATRLARHRSEKGAPFKGR
jgi:DNA-binding CsgD family transcriptional regulator